MALLPVLLLLLMVVLVVALRVVGGQKGESVEVIAVASAAPAPVDLPETPMAAGAGPQNRPRG